MTKKTKISLKTVILLLSALGFNFIVYYGGRLLAQGKMHHDITTEIDRKIPFVPGMSWIYWACYLFWAVNYYICIQEDKYESRNRRKSTIKSRYLNKNKAGDKDRNENGIKNRNMYKRKIKLNQFLLAHFLGEMVCFLVFVFFPTAMVRPEVTGTGIFDWLLKMTYAVDEPNNLLPSIHCFVSWLCWVGVRKHPKVPRWYQWVSLGCAFSVCVCTLTIRQHVLGDVVTGVLLAEASYFVSHILIEKSDFMI